MNNNSTQAGRFTPAEQLILDHLQKKAPEIVERHELAKLCDIPRRLGVPVSNVVDVHIKNMRQKLSTDCIETVRGVGYRYVV